jgi:hypothetical protein
LGQFIALLALIMAVLGFWLGRRKTEHPILMAIIGFCSGFFPPFALVFVFVLALRKDIKQKEPTV